MTRWQQVVEMARRFPGVEESVSYGEPSLKIRRALLTRWRTQDDSIVLLDVDPFERDHLSREEPAIYFLEDHYAGHDIVLARLAHIGAAPLEMFLERRWRNVAPKQLVRAFDAA